MSEKIETLKIISKDRYGESCLQDKVFGNDKNERKPKGYVEVYEVSDEGNEKLIGKSNLVLYQGREWLISRAFNAVNGSITPQPTEFIYWVGLGDGGCYGYDPLTPIPPTNLDTELNHPIPINPTNSAYADFVSGEGYYKMPYDSLTFEQDSDNDNKYLIGRVTITVGINDGNGYALSEAGLYTAASSTGGYAGPFNLYAKVTFSSVVKTSTRQLIFVWYLYF